MTDPFLIVALAALAGLALSIISGRKLAKRFADIESSLRFQERRNLQMRRFADVVMRLITGEPGPAIWQNIAETISSTSPFLHVTIALSADMRNIHVEGFAGLIPENLSHTNAVFAEIPLEWFRSYFAHAEHMAPNSFRLPVGAIEMAIAPNPKWPTEDSVVVPICSLRGACMGVILLSGVEDIFSISAENFAGLELLASYIALSVENTTAKRRTFQAEKLEGMGQLVAGVAHELNNPLTAVLGYTEILAEKTDDPSMRYDLSVMRREALRMKRIIESLQQFSRKQRVEREKVNINNVIHQAVESRSEELREQKIEVIKQLSPQLPEIIANQELIDQVFQNVFANAVEAVHHSSLKRILIETRAHGNQVHIQVSDTGPGFKDETRVFDPFYTTKGPGKGTGLGLSLSYGIIRDHGGEITASNLHPLGACISIQLPIGALDAQPNSTLPASIPRH